MKQRFFLRISLLLAVILLGLQPAAAQQAQKGNPFFQARTTPFQTPPFDKISKEHFLPAFKEGIKREQAEIDAIVARKQAPNFANTIAAMDHSGIFLNDVSSVFYALLGAETNDDLQAIAREVSPLLSAHQDNINLNAKLFARVKAVYDQRQKLTLTPEESFLLENTYKGFIRSGAQLDETQKARLRVINQQLSLLGLKFGQQMLAETNSSRIVIDSAEGLAGLPESVRAMGADTAKSLGLEGKWAFTTQVPSMTPFLQSSTRRDLREQLHRAYFMRGDRDNANDNKEIVKQIVSLRAERARLLGYPTYAHFVLEERMAKDPATVMAFLNRLWAPALARSRNEAAEMQAIIDREKGGFQLASWDWWHYAEKLRQEKYAFDDALLRPYFALENVKKGIFTLCEKLYGLQFLPLANIPLYHPEVQVYEVRESSGSHVGLLYMDFHPRPGKRGGAWSGGFRRAYYEKGKRVAPALHHRLQLHPPRRRRSGIAEHRRGQHVLPRVRPLAGHPVLQWRLPRPQRPPRRGGTAVADHGELGPGARVAQTLRPPLPERRSDPGSAGGKTESQQPVQPGIRDRGIPGRLVPGHGLAYRERQRGRRRAQLRGRGHGRARPDPGYRAALPHHLLQPHDLRLRRRLLQLHLVRGAGQGRLRGLQGEGHLR